MDQSSLFPLPEPERRERSPARAGETRVRRPNRQQVEWAPRDLDSLLPENHMARAIWGLLERLDLSVFYTSIKAVVDRPGRPATDPMVLLAVWSLATVEGIGSARQLTRLCEEHDAYRWLRGGVPVNYHMLADFRSCREQELDALLTQVVGILLAADAVSLTQVAQDGMRVRASAGASSFRREEKLKACLEAAKQQVEALAKAREQGDAWVSKREERARERAAREREARIEQALSYLPEALATKGLQRKRAATEEKGKVTEPRISTTDPEARVMKMPDGGYRPGYNVQFATDSVHGVIVGVGVTNSGSDAHQAPAMVEQIEQRTGRKPDSYLMDGGFAVREDITLLGQHGITVYAPVRQPRWKPASDRHLPRYGDTAEVVAWRERMSTEKAGIIYRRRASLAEWTNAQARRHGVSQFNVRGLAKGLSSVLLVAMVHNLLRWLSWERRI
jgi:transposase